MTADKADQEEVSVWLDYDFTVKVDSHSYWVSEYGRAAKPTDSSVFRQGGPLSRRHSLRPQSSMFQYSESQPFRSPVPVIELAKAETNPRQIRGIIAPA